MQAIFYTLFLLLGSYVTGLEAQDYSFVESKNGIDMYAKVDETTGQEWTKLVIELDASVSEITSYTGNIDNLTSWVYACDKVKLLEQQNLETIYYLVSDMPYPMTDRDVIIRKIIEEGASASYVKTVSESYTEVNLESDLIRIPRFKAIWVYEQLSSGKTRITYEVSADSGGSIPNWVKDRFAYYGPLRTLENLRDRFE